MGFQSQVTESETVCLLMQLPIRLESKKKVTFPSDPTVVAVILMGVRKTADDAPFGKEKEIELLSFDVTVEFENEDSSEFP